MQEGWRCPAAFWVDVEMQRQISLLAPARIHLLLLLCQANSPCCLSWLLAGVSGSGLRIAASVSPWKQLRDAAEQSCSQPWSCSSAPLLAQEPLSGRRGKLSPSSIFPQESETLSSGENGNVIRSACVEQIENQF